MLSYPTIPPNNSAQVTKCSRCMEGVGRGLYIKMCRGEFNEVESFVNVRLHIDPNLTCDGRGYHNLIFKTFAIITKETAR